MEIIFLPDADEDLNYWVKSGNKAIIKKLLNSSSPSIKVHLRELVNLNL